jgi:hypothetical protein
MYLKATNLKTFSFFVKYLVKLLNNNILETYHHAQKHWSIVTNIKFPGVSIIYLCVRGFYKLNIEMINMKIYRNIWQISYVTKTSTKTLVVSRDLV